MNVKSIFNNLYHLNKMEDKELSGTAISLGLDLKKYGKELEPGKYLIHDRGGLIDSLRIKLEERLSIKSIILAKRSLYLSIGAILVALLQAVAEWIPIFREYWGKWFH